ncbi:MAG: hypothetical protein C6I00_05365 [Nitratiruptor sp.]|nr:hypothetical protein [Nitratiruptor sp.]NPA83528.1 WD40 repeat domain-containing protein [Campylobacterota bacterium]
MRGLFLFLLGIWLYGATLHPIEQIDINAAVLDVALEGDRIYVATDASKVLILERKGLKVIETIQVRQIKDFMGELNNADIYSVDVLDGKVLYLAQAEDGYAELFLHENGKSRKVLDKSLQMYAKAAKFIDAKRAFLTLMSDEVVLYDLEQGKVLKTIKAGDYFYSTMAIDSKRRFLVVGDEGGEVALIDLSAFQRVKLFKDVNKDKILSLAVEGDLIAAGSRADKAFALYQISTGKAKVLRNPDFFVYVVGLSQDGNYALYGDNEHYILKLVDTQSLRILHQLQGHTHIVNVIRFLDERTLISGSETGEIMKWRLP